MNILRTAKRLAQRADMFVTGPFAAATQRPVLRALLWLVPGALYLTALAIYNVNMPEGDDIHGLVEFLLRYDAAPDLLQKSAVVLTPHNMHFILLQHLACVLNLELTGAVDFNVLKWVGAAGLAGTMGLLWSAARPLHKTSLFLTPLPLLLLSAKQWVNMVSAICALTWNWNLLLGFGALALLAQSERHPENGQNQWLHVAAVAVALLCALSLLGGIAALAVGAGFLAVRRRWLAAGLWLALCVVVFAVAKNGDAGSLSHSRMLTDALASPVDLLLFFCSLCGGILRIGAQSITSMLFGLLLIAGALRLVVFGAPRPGMDIDNSTANSAANKTTANDAALRLFAAYLLLLCGSIALGRMHLGPRQAFESRYMLLPCALAFTVYAAYAPRLTQVSRRFAPYVLLAALALNIGSHIDSHSKFQTRLAGMTTDRDQLLRVLETPSATLPDGLAPEVVELAQKGLFHP